LGYFDASDFDLFTHRLSLANIRSLRSSSLRNPWDGYLVISMDLVKVTSKHEWLSNEFLYRLMRTREFKQHCLGHSNGSTVLHLSKKAIPSYEIFMPPKDRIEEFTELAKGLLDKKFENITQVRTLEKLRDNLLPKLMSGEVQVKLSIEE
jgi:type I restriction enzyme, S subunit